MTSNETVDTYLVDVDANEAVVHAHTLDVEARNAIIDDTLFHVCSEYTVMPRYAFHQPLDYLIDTEPFDFGGEPIEIDGVSLLLPPVGLRGGYLQDHEAYLESGRRHHEVYRDHIFKVLGPKRDLTVLEIGCATGRVLRHFNAQRQSLDWNLVGCDIQASHIEWLRQYWPKDITVFTGTVIPTLPLPDNSVDVIYGMSVFTHIKYHWDAWIMELKRVLKPGGVLMQTIHAETAWKFYYNNRHLDWVQAAISEKILTTPEMDVDYFLQGDINVSQTFFKREIARKYWSRYMNVLNIEIPETAQDIWFQDLIIAQKPPVPKKGFFSNLLGRS